jgi:hypothetical protein
MCIHLSVSRRTHRDVSRRTERVGLTHARKGKLSHRRAVFDALLESEVYVQGTQTSVEHMLAGARPAIASLSLPRYEIRDVLCSHAITALPLTRRLIPVMGLSFQIYSLSLSLSRARAHALSL